MTLTARQVDTAKPREKPYKLTDGEGLYLYVAPSGTKSWRANYTAAGKQKTRTYGLYPAVSLADARTAHRAARGAKPDAMPASTMPAFRVVAKQWLRKKLPELSNPKHRQQVETTLERFAFPRLGDLPIDKIPRKLLVEVVQAALVDKARPGADTRLETAHRLAGRITAVFDYAQDAGIIDGHAASHLTRVLQARKTTTPMPCIPKEQAGQLMRDILLYPEAVTRLGLLLAAHTFVRTNEILGFQKDELREAGAIWVVPEERMKGEDGEALPHVVPLSRQARGIVTQLMEMSGCDLVLESPAAPGRPLSENTLLFALYRLGYKGRHTVHGFRALASTVLNEESPFSKDAIEKQLAHKETDAVRAAYNRALYLPERRKMMAWWSDWLDAAMAAAAPRATATAP